MTSFKTRITEIASQKGKVILANDYDNTKNKLETKTIKNIKTLNKYLCGIKLNFQLLLPLGFKEISNINKIAHKYNLQSIADIKLNDIGNTNSITVETLWNLGFDAVIVNPIMGQNSLKKLISLAHKKNKGIIALCHMSAPEAKSSYEMNVKAEKTKQQTKLYQLFLKWSISHKADGIIVGATFPEIIKFCKSNIKNSMNIYSPGIGVQGGKVKQVLSSGTDFLIIGRAILNAKNPINEAKKFQKLSFAK